jgi:hypothetical protein
LGTITHTPIQSIFPDAGRKTLAMVNSSSPPPVSALAGSFLNALARIEQPFIVVQDDYHHIQEESVHNLLIQLLSHPPQSLHLIMIGRRDPTLPISALKAKGQVTEIRTQDLLGMHNIYFLKPFHLATRSSNYPNPLPRYVCIHDSNIPEFQPSLRGCRPYVPEATIASLHHANRKRSEPSSGRMTNQDKMVAL